MLSNDGDVGGCGLRCKVKDYLFGFKGERCVASSDGRGAFFVAVGRVVQTAAEEKWFYMYVSRDVE